MRKAVLPPHYLMFRNRYKRLADAMDEMGKASHQEGPLDEKTAQLIQLAAAASIHSEGGVHSHVRRAQEAGAGVDEIRHAVLLLTTTVGFPTTMAALSWVEDVLQE